MPEFKIIGDNVRRCLDSGSWSGYIPKCLERSLINDVNDIDNFDLNSTNNLQLMQSTKAIGIGISVAIGVLLLLTITVAIVCLKT
jgi:hypothetical protein